MGVPQKTSIELLVFNYRSNISFVGYGYFDLMKFQDSKPASNLPTEIKLFDMMLFTLI